MSDEEQLIDDTYETLQDTDDVTVSASDSVALVDEAAHAVEQKAGHEDAHEDAHEDEHDEDFHESDDDEVDDDESLGEPLPPIKVMRIIQAAILVHGEPMTFSKIMKLFKRPKPEVTLVKQLMKEIAEEYEDHDVLRFVQTASGYQFQLAPDLSPWILRLWEHKPPRYTRATLETLAIIAYKQPVTRGEIEQIRGVAVSNHIIKSLLDRGWIDVVGTREVPGRPSLFGTTKAFLDYFNLRKLTDLPELPELSAMLAEKSQPVSDDTPIVVKLPPVTDGASEDEMPEDATETVELVEGEESMAPRAESDVDDDTVVSATDSDVEVTFADTFTEDETENDIFDTASTDEDDVEEIEDAFDDEAEDIADLLPAYLAEDE